MASTSTAASTAISPEQEALKALTFQRLHPKAYLERFLAENARPDGREPHEWRDVSVNVGPCLCVMLRSAAERVVAPGSISTANGSALVRLGDTTVVCGVKAEIAEPELDCPEDGFFGMICLCLDFVLSSPAC
jgi:exosome complex component RRP43